MKLAHKQRGITAIGILIILGLIGFFVLIGLTLAPIYLENFDVGSHVKSLESERNLVNMSDAQIVATLMKRFNIDNVDNVKEENVAIDETTDGLKVTVDYEVRSKVFGNVDVVVSFTEVANIKLK